MSRTAVIPHRHDRRRSALPVASAAVTDTASRATAAWPSALAVALAAALVCAFLGGSLIDDAYIALAYARNLALYGHWGLLRHTASNTATSPLNVVMLALFTLFTRDPKIAMTIVFVLANVTAYYAFRKVAVRDGFPIWFALLASALIILNPLVVSTVGMEMTLGVALSAVLLSESGDRPALAGVLAGLLVLTRPDLTIVALTLLVGRESLRRGWHRSVPAMIAVAAPWFVASWLEFGSAVPDTLIIKLQQKAWAGGYTFANGWKWYLAAFPVATVLGFLPPLLGLVALIVWAARRTRDRSERARRLDSVAVLAVAGILHFAAYSALGVPPYHWYYVPAIAALTIFLAASVAAFADDSAEAVRTGWTAAVLLPRVLAALLVVADTAFLARGLKPPAYAPITTNWASSSQYAQIGLELRQRYGNSVIGSPGEIGGIVYYCGCVIVDAFSDRGWLPRLVRQVEADRGSLTRALIDLNYKFLDWNMTPRRREFVMRYVKAPPPRAVVVWPVDSPGAGPMYLALMRER